MSGRDYLSVADVLGMHTVLMQRYGGALGLRDPGALEVALFRPQTGYYEDIVGEAAALMESLAGHHPFLDGISISRSIGRCRPVSSPVREVAVTAACAAPA